MPYSFYALLSVTIFCCVHLWAEKASTLKKGWHGRLLSAGGGIAIAYVFIDLLPKLGINDALIRNRFHDFFPFLEKHAYIMALAGFLLFFSVGKSDRSVNRQESFWISLSSYALFNFLVGYAVVDKDDPEVKPLALFTFAMGLHYFVNDYTLSETYGYFYQRYGKKILILSLLLGWLTGVWITLSETAVALVSAFIGGGVIMNVMRHELPQDKPNDLKSFLFAALAYTAVLLSVG